MRPADTLAAARIQTTMNTAPHLHQGWDGKRYIGNVFQRTLRLTCSAWDVYLLYPLSIMWNEDEPPAPTFWMHHLLPEQGGDPALCLQPESLFQAAISLVVESRLS